MNKKLDVLSIITIFLLCVTTIVGILSLNFQHSYYILNQYIEPNQMYGYGIYSHDTFFKATISIGTDFCMLFVLVPMFVKSYIQHRKDASSVSRLRLISVYAVALYYATSMSFGVTYNKLHLIYILLFSCSLFGMFYHIRNIDLHNIHFKLTKGMKLFLLLSGIALIIAWMPDIIPTLFTGDTLSLIGVYTTEITYVLDIGIIGPLCILSIYLSAKGDSLSALLCAVLFKLCLVVGVMVIPQTLCQIAGSIEMTLPVLITKIGSFVALGIFAFYFNAKLYKQLR